MICAIFIYIIAPKCAKMIEDKESKAYFEFIISNKANSKYTSELHEYVEDAKHNQQWRHEYMTWETIKSEAYNNGLKKGVIQGQEQKAIETAKRMLIKKYPTNDISEITGLSLDTILELQKNLPVNA